MELLCIQFVITGTGFSHGQFLQHHTQFITGHRDFPQQISATSTNTVNSSQGTGFFKGPICATLTQSQFITGLGFPTANFCSINAHSQFITGHRKKKIHGQFLQYQQTWSIHCRAQGFSMANFCNMNKHNQFIPGASFFHGQFLQHQQSTHHRSQGFSTANFGKIHALQSKQLQHTDFTCQGLIWERALSLSPHYYYYYYYYYYTHQQPLPKAIPSIVFSFQLFFCINFHVLCTIVDMSIIMSTLFHTWTDIILPPGVDYFTLGLTLSSCSGRIISHLDLHYSPTQSGLFHTWIYIILPLRADYFTLRLTFHSGRIISHFDLHYHATQGGLFHTWT